MTNIEPVTDSESLSAKREIEDLHAFFTEWYNGTIVNTDDIYQRFSRVMDENFHMITPNADVLDREKVLRFVREGWGQFNKQDEFAIEIRNFRVMRRISQNTILVLYEEWQTEPGRLDTEGRITLRGRLSAAGLRADERMVNGWAWLFVHEVWLPE